VSGQPRRHRAFLGLVERWLGLADGEGGRAVRLLSLVFSMSAGLALLKAAQSGIFLLAYPRSTIPWAFAASAVTLASLSMLSVPLAARLGPVKLCSLTLGCSSAVLVALRGLLWMGPPHVPFALYVLVEAICGLLLIQVWSVVSQATNARSAKRLLPVAGIGATTAWTIGGLLVPAIVHSIGAPGLLLITPALLMVALVLVGAVARYDLDGEGGRSTTRASMLTEWRNGLSFVLEVPLMRIMAVLSVLALVTEQLMDYQMMAAARERFGGQAQVAAFFGTYYGLTSAVSLLMLFGASGRALATLGASRSLLFVPLLTCGVAIGAALVPGFGWVVAMRASDRVLKQSLWSSASEQTQTPLPILRRAQSRALIRGVIAPAGYAVAALGLAMLPASFDLRYLAAMTAVLASIMCVIILGGVRRAYQKALQQAVDDRKLDLLDGSGRALDADAALQLAGELKSHDPTRASLAAELLRSSASPLAVGALSTALAHPAGLVRAIAADALGNLRAVDHASSIAALLESDPDPTVRHAAAKALLQLSPPLSLVEVALTRGAVDADDRVRAASKVASAALADPEGYERGTALLKLLGSKDRAETTEALSALGPGALGSPQVAIALRDLLVDKRDLVLRKEALRTVGRLRDPLLLPQLMKLLDDPDVSADAAASLSEWGDDALAPLGSSIGPAADAGARPMMGAITLAPGGNSGQTLFVRLLSHADSAVRERAGRALSNVVRGGKRAPLSIAAVEPLLDREIASAYKLYCVLGGLAHDDGTPDWEIEPAFRFLAGEIERRIFAIRNRTLRLLSLLGNTRVLRGVEFGLRRPTPAVDAKVAELLELVLEPSLARKIVPLFDRLSLRERAEVARKLGFFAESAARDPLGAIVELKDDHVRGCAILTYGPRFAERFPTVYEAEAALIPLFERMTFLRSVPLFGELSGEDLRSVAEIVELVELPAGDVIFRKGDPGEDLFLILRGRVSVRDGKIEVATLGEREFFGELAVLDREPRSADIVCLEDAKLLRLRSADLGELMARRPQIYEQILLVLVRRLRGTTQRVVQ
jgi:HEAT repeat protein